MFKKIITVVSFAILTILLWFLYYTYSYYYIFKGFQTLLALTLVYLIFRLILEEFISKKIKSAKAKYSFNKTISILYILFFILALIYIWVEQTETLLISYGLIGAGIAVSLQDVFRNFAGGIVIFLTGIYRVGDRIDINSKIGDVIEIGVFYTTMMEVGELSENSQATGRISLIPNSFVLSSNINNFTKDHSFIWDEITIPITYDSNWQKSSYKLLDIVKNETSDIAEKADKEISRLGEKYYLPKKPVDPVVFLNLTDNWINLTIRYVTDTKNRRELRDKINRLILTLIEDSKDITIASENVDVYLKKIIK
jgi:small-conductance mechanosensitive channel